MIQNTASGADDAFAADLLRGHTDTIVLGVLRRQDSYGFEIYKTIRDATGGSYEIKEATLYATFRRLERDGLVEAYWGDESQGGRRKYYRITDRGLAELAEQRRQWDTVVDALKEIWLGRGGRLRLTSIPLECRA